MKETPKGYWIEGNKWISNYARKRSAYPTKEEAWESFKCRKERQVSILKMQLRIAEMVNRLQQPE